MGPTHNNQNGPGGLKKRGSVKITTPGWFTGNAILAMSSVNDTLRQE